MTGQSGNAPEALLERLGDLVGTRVRFQGMPCLVADVIVAPALLILKPEDSPAEIQPDVYDAPRRLGPRLIEVPVFTEDGLAVNPELTLLRPADES